MIKRTAQEWADFTGETFYFGSELFCSENFCFAINSKKVFISDFDQLKEGQKITPSEPCTLVPDRILAETAETLERMNKALDEKIGGLK